MSWEYRIFYPITKGCLDIAGDRDVSVEKRTDVYLVSIDMLSHKNIRYGRVFMRELGYRSQIQSSQKNGKENESTIEWKEGEMEKGQNVLEVRG